MNSDSRRFAEIAEAVGRRLAKNQPVRRTLPGEGRLRIDRQLPFLCIYRAPPHEDTGTQELVTTEAAYLFASGADEHHDGLSNLCQRIAVAMREHFGVFLFLEIWAQIADTKRVDSEHALQPAFEIVAPDIDSLPATITAFTDALARITIRGQSADVRTRKCEQVAPPGLTPLPHQSAAGLGGCVAMGLAVRPIYRDAASGTLFPMILQTLRSQLPRALRKAVSQLTGFESSSDSLHYQSLGPTSLVKAARLVDQQLCEVSESFDFLLQATPTNTEKAWQAFQDSGHQTAPRLYYRPLPYHPSLLKRRLFEIEIERIEDPTLAHLFWEKQDELDRQITALRDIDTPHFLYTSLQLYGHADDELFALAKEILSRFPGGSSQPAADDGYLPVAAVAQRAREEIDYYHQRMRAFNAQVEVCDHIAAGIMVSRDRLLIADTVRVRAARLEPLLHHEVGTHLLTYFNGRSQPFRQLYAGLAGYDELQEGLAVMAEYFTGGLTVSRLRTFAGRVIAVRSMTDEATFADTFARLREEFGFTPRQAYVTTLRVYRGGGLTKDVVYLRGLRDVLKYLASGHDLHPLYVGKIGLPHVPYVQEMRRRGIIEAPSVLPRFWNDARMRERLEACRGLSVVELVEVQE